MYIVAYRFKFSDDIDMASIEETLFLSVIAVEAIYGRPRARLEVDFQFRAQDRECVISGEDELSQILGRIFFEFVNREIGELGFHLNGVPGGRRLRIAASDR